jgi:hypothetical protein
MDKTNNKIIWITWENQRRNREISSWIGAELFELLQVERIQSPIKKYAYGLIKTYSLLIRIRPRIVICQNPSIVLSLFICILAKPFNFFAIVDAHNGGIFPLEGKSRSLMAISHLIQKLASLTIVTNDALKIHVIRNGGRSFVLPDPIPRFGKVPQRNEFSNTFNVLYISSFARDEPYENVFRAAHILGRDFRILVTGNHKKANINYDNLPENIDLLGYIPERRFIEILHSANITMDLTTRENCLLCGAYESTAAGKPMVLSATKALRSYFNKGAVYTENSPECIANSIKFARKNFKQLKDDVMELKVEKEMHFEKLINDFRTLIIKVTNYPTLFQKNFKQF